MEKQKNLIYSTSLFHKIFVTVLFFISWCLNSSHYITHQLLVVYSIKGTQGMCLSCFIEEIQVKSKQYLGLRTLDYPMSDVALEFVF